jgi:hypothetical protein
VPQRNRSKLCTQRFVRELHVGLFAPQSADCRLLQKTSAGRSRETGLVARKSRGGHPLLFRVRPPPTSPALCCADPARACAPRSLQSSLIRSHASSSSRLRVRAVTADDESLATFSFSRARTECAV